MGHFDLLLLLFSLGLVALQTVEVVDQEVDEFNLPHVLSELIFFLSLFISLLILSLSGLSFFISNFSVFDSDLPFDKIDEVLLLPVVVKFLVILIPKLGVFLLDLGDFFFEFIKTDLFVLFPVLVLLIVTLFFIILLGLFDCHLLS